MGQKSREKQARKEDGFITEKKKAGANIAPILWWIIFSGVSLILFTPFIVGSKYFFPFVGPKSIYFMAFSEIIFSIWLILIIIDPKYRPRLNILTAAIILFLIVSILSSVFGVDFFRSFWSKYERMTGLLMQFHLCGFFLVVSSVFRKKEDWLKILGISVFAAILMSFVSLYPKAMGEISSLTRGGATLGNSSFLGTYLLFNLFFAIYLFFSSGKLIKTLSFLAALAIGISLFLSTARAAFFSALIGLVLLFLLWLVFNPKAKVRLVGIILITVLFVLGIASAFLITKPGNFLHQAFFDNFISSNFGGRFIVWEGAWKGFLAKPWLGWGLENFEISFTRNYNPCMGTGNCGGDVWYDRAHNIVFDTLVTTGILGLLAYLGIFFSAFFVLWRQFFKQNITFWAAGIFSVVLVSYFIQNLSVFDMINSYVMFFLVLAFIGSASRDRADSLQTEKPVNFALAAVILVLFVFSFSVSVINSEKADGYIIKALGFPVGSTERLDFYKKTLQTSSVGKYQIRDFFAQSDLEFFQSDRVKEVPPDNLKREFDFITQEMEKSVKESPLDYRAYLKLGQMYNIYALMENNANNLLNAENILKKAVEISPTNQQGYWALAQTEIYLGKIEESLSLAEKALELNPNSKQSNLIVIQIAKIMGNNDLAQKKFEEAVKIDPSWEADLKSFLDN